MHLKLKMNRPMNPNTDPIDIVPGGYDIETGNKHYKFDFDSSYGNVDPTDNTCINFECEDPSADEFPDINAITPDVIAKMSQFTECFVYTGEPGTTETKPEKILSCKFTFNDGTEVALPTNILETAGLSNGL